MVSRPRIVVAALVIALAAVGFTVSTAQAAVARVSGLASAGEDHYNARLKVRWKAVPGATYQVRWAGTPSALGRAKVATSTARGATSPALNRCVTNYVQVRAVKGGSVGPWSKAKALKFTNRRPASSTVGGVGITNGVKFTWNRVTNATRYRVRWNAGPFGKFAGGDAVVSPGWVNQYAREVTLKLPTTPKAGDKMMGVAYANPVFVRFDANNQCKPTIIPWTPYRAFFPAAPDPGPGDAVRAGTYNTELFPSGGYRIAGLAKNIRDHALEVVALQEANQATATALVNALGSAWAAVPTDRASGQQILFRNDKFRLDDSGDFTVRNSKPGGAPLVTPWGHLVQRHPSDPDRAQGLYVVSVHLSENPNASQMTKKANAGAAAGDVLRNIAALNTTGDPVIATGDFRYLREPFNDVPGYVEAPPTMVRGGFYDAMAARKKVNIAYTTVNQHKVQSPSLAGVASRADYIFLKGFKGSRAYVNVANWRYNGAWVSDHNLVYADLTIPYAD